MKISTFALAFLPALMMAPTTVTASLSSSLRGTAEEIVDLLNSLDDAGAQQRQPDDAQRNLGKLSPVEVKELIQEGIQKHQEAEEIKEAKEQEVAAKIQELITKQIAATLEVELDKVLIEFRKQALEEDDSEDDSSEEEEGDGMKGKTKKKGMKGKKKKGKKGKKGPKKFFKKMKGGKKKGGMKKKKFGKKGGKKGVTPRPNPTMGGPENGRPMNPPPQLAVMPAVEEPEIPVPPAAPEEPVATP